MNIYYSSSSSISLPFRAASILEKYYKWRKLINLFVSRIAAIMMEDQQTGRRYLRVRDFLSFGISSSILTSLVIITIGYGLMLIAGF